MVQFAQSSDDAVKIDYLFQYIAFTRKAPLPTAWPSTELHCDQTRGSLERAWRETHLHFGQVPVPGRLQELALLAHRGQREASARWPSAHQITHLRHAADRIRSPNTEIYGSYTDKGSNVDKPALMQSCDYSCPSYRRHVIYWFVVSVKVPVPPNGGNGHVFQWRWSHPEVFQSGKIFVRSV